MAARGFVDIQVNGLLGINFTTPGLTVEGVRRVTRALTERGTIAYCPTVLEAAEDTLRENLSVLAQAMREPDLRGHILGIHLEGPFLSPIDGARGAHDAAFLRKPSIAFLDKLQEWAGGGVCILTLAPELDGAEQLIRYAAQSRIAVALGHTAMDEPAFRRAVAAGAKLSTHLGNGIPDQINRHHNPVWWQLAEDSMSASLVTDGHHLPAALIKTALRAKGVERCIVVSDSMSIAALSPGEYTVGAKKMKLDETGRVSLIGTPYLAGSSATMLTCMNYLSSLDLLSEDDLWRVAADNPLRLLGKSTDALAGLAAPAIEYREGRFAVEGFEEN